MTLPADRRKSQVCAAAFIVFAIVTLLVTVGVIRPSDVARDWKDDERLIIRP
jgi:hypothetical protein